MSSPTPPTISSPYAPDLAEVRAWIEKRIAALKFGELVLAILALISRMRDINLELMRQLAHLRRARPRSETLRRLEGQLTLPLQGFVTQQAKPTASDRARAKESKASRKGKHPGRAALPAHLPRVERINAVPAHERTCPLCGRTMTTVGHQVCEILEVEPARIQWCGAGGWRLGTFAFPPGLRWLLEAMAVVASESFTTTSAPIQHGAVRAFEGGPDIEEYLTRARRILSALVGWATRALERAGARIEPAAGAFYLFPDFTPLASTLRAREITTSDDLCTRLLAESGVALLPGSAFGRPPEELTARVALVDFDGARAMAALASQPPGAALGDDFLRTYCVTVADAVERLCAWLGRG